MIHPSSIIDSTAKIADSVEIGPFCLIGPDVEIEEETKIESHVILKGPTKIGKRNHIFQLSIVGDGSPDKKYKDEPTLLKIGNDNIIREGVTIHRGTVQDQGETIIGNRNLIMAYSHIAHDCVIGNNAIFANNATLAGHVEVGDEPLPVGIQSVKKVPSGPPCPTHTPPLRRDSNLAHTRCASLAEPNLGSLRIRVPGSSSSLHE